jgi:predicted amidohydrolase
LKQGESNKSAVHDNITTVSYIANQAHLANVDIILFPELFLTGYDVGVEYIKNCAMSIDGSEIAKIKEIALNNQIAIAVGYPEKDLNINSIYNSCVLIDACGNIVMNYRKIHLWDPFYIFEKLAFTSGEELNACELYIPRHNITIKIGMLICFDR